MAAQRTDLLTALRTIQADLQKSASDVSDGGPTTHPVKNVDDGTVPFKEGERSRENEADVKKQVGGDNIEVATGQGQDSDKLKEVQSTGGGLNARPTGEDPAAEDDYKDRLKDPGTSMPAKVGDGEKYAKCGFEENIKTATQLGNELLAAIATPNTKAAAATPTATTPTTPTPATALVSEFDKDASANTEAIIAATLQDACYQADLLGGYLHTLYKQAAEEAAPLTDTPSAPEESSSNCPTGGPPEGGALAGDAGGLPPGAGAGGPPPGMDAGGPPPGMGAGGGMPDAGMSQDDALQQLVAGLAEMGITPDMLAQAAQQAAPNPMGGPAEKMAHVASTALSFMRSGKYQIAGPTKTAKERQIRDKAKAYIQEISNASH